MSNGAITWTAPRTATAGGQVVQQVGVVTALVAGVIACRSAYRGRA